MGGADPARNGPKIAVIGFNKCGTSSLTSLFRNGGHNSAHWKTDSGKFIAPLLYANFHLRRPIFAGLAQFLVISDLFYLDQNVYLEANALFSVMARQYPQTRFILNTREREGWIRSRCNHVTPGMGSLIERAAEFFGCGSEAVKDIWRAQWERHHREVRAFFAASPQRLLEFDIEKDDPEILANWLGKEMPVDPRQYRKINASR